MDGSQHLQWFPRDLSDSAGRVKIMLTEGGQELERVDTGRGASDATGKDNDGDGDRVFLLQSKVLASRRFFFWMQEPDASNDDKLLTTVNKLFGITAPANTSGGVSQQQLDDILRGFGFEAPAPQEQQQTRQPVQPQAPRSLPIPINAVVNNDRVKALIEKPEVQAALLPMLPEGMQTVEELRATLNTPQFQMALRRLSAACVSGQYNDIVSNFQLNHADGAAEAMQGNLIGAVIAAIAAKAERECEASGANSGGADGGTDSDAGDAQ